MCSILRHCPADLVPSISKKQKGPSLRAGTFYFGEDDATFLWLDGRGIEGPGVLEDLRLVEVEERARVLVLLVEIHRPQPKREVSWHWRWRAVVFSCDGFVLQICGIAIY